MANKENINKAKESNLIGAPSLAIPVSFNPGDKIKTVVKRARWSPVKGEDLFSAWDDLPELVVRP